MSSNNSIGTVIGTCLVIALAAKVLPSWGESKTTSEPIKRFTDNQFNFGQTNLGQSKLGLLGQNKITSGSASANLILSALPISFGEDFFAALKQARQEKKPLVLFMYRKGGQHSNAMASTLADSSMNQFATRAVYVKAEEQSRVAATYMKELHIAECPAVVVLDPTLELLQEVGHTTGDFSAADYVPKFRDLLAKADKDIKAGQLIAQAIELYRNNPSGRNNAAILKLLEQAADLGSVQALNELGTRYINGEGVAVDYAKAMDYLRKAAADNSAMATYNIGVLYEKGWGVPANLATAISYYRKAAEEGDLKAQFTMGNAYRKGIGVTKDLSAAISWYTRAGERGQFEAAREAGVMFRDGEGIVRNYVEALKWFKLAAGYNDSDAVANLGWLYENGFGVEKDLAKANDYFKQAADLGNTWAKDKLAGK